MTPSEREEIDLEIYFETKNHRGCIEDAADFLRHRDPSRVSRLLNPSDKRANCVFGEALDLLQGLNHKHPELAKFIWMKMTLAVNSFMNTSEEDIKLAELAEIADSAVREQLDVNFAISNRKTPEEIKQEAFQALEKSRLQYEKANALKNQSARVVSEAEQ